MAGWPAAPTIRLFVSSTFSDLTTERDVLQREVFPALRRRCASGGFRFQPIDLRWGISEEAGRHNRTMRICLRELRRCQAAGRPKPNFLILLGERYGWCPLPERIPANLFHRLHAYLASADPASAETLAARYRIDENAVPPVAELQPRHIDEKWEEQIEMPLLAALQGAAGALAVDLDAEGVAVGSSATEQEIVAGALTVADASDHVRAFFRTIEGLPDPPPGAYVDRHNPTARQSLTALQERIDRHLGQQNVHRFTVPWRDGIQAVDLEEFAARALSDLEAIVTKQMEAIEAEGLAYIEEQSHQQFGAGRGRWFVGRADALEGIEASLSDDSEAPLAIVGPPGCGKSAVMARLAQALRRHRPEAHVIARYIGATPSSSDLVQMLGNVVRDIRGHYPAGRGQMEEDDQAFAVDAEGVTNAFFDALARPSAGAPLFLLFDGLDQLTTANDARALAWLPKVLPPHAHLIVSAASAEIVEDPSVWPALTKRVAAERRIALAPLSRVDGNEIVDLLLAAAQRSLQDAQREAILEAFSIEGNPLWLHIAAGEASRMPSWSAPPSLPSSVPALLHDVLERLSREEEHGRLLVSHAMGYLASARHGLAEDEMLDVLSADQEVMADFRRRSPQERQKGVTATNRLPVSVWVALLGDLEAYLSEQQAHGTLVLTFYHRSFKKAADAVGSGDWHVRLARYFRGQARGMRDDPWRGASTRPLSELAFHLRQAGQDKELQQLYSDVAYLDARCRSLARASGTTNPDMLEFVSELRDATGLFARSDAAAAAPLQALVRLLIDRNVLLSRFPENAAQEIGNYLPRYGDGSLIDRIVERARTIPASLGLHRATYPNVAGLTSEVTALVASPSGNEFLAGAEDGALGYWSVSGARPLWIAAGHEQRVTSIAFSDEGTHALTAGRDGGILLWNLPLASRRLYRPLGAHASHAWVGGFLDDDTAVVGVAGAVLTLDLASGRVLWRTPGEGQALPALSWDRRLVCVHGQRSRGGSLTHTLQLYVVGGTSTEVTTLRRPPELLMFNRQNDAIVAADGSGHVLAYSLDGKRLSDTIARPPLAEWCCMPDGRMVAADRGGETLCASGPGAPWQPLALANPNRGRRTSALAPLPGNRLLAGAEDGSIAMADLTARSADRVWESGVGFATGAVLADGSAAAITGERRQGESILGRELYLVSASGNVERVEGTPHAQLLAGVSALGGRVVSADRGGRIVTWRGTAPDRMFVAQKSRLTCCGPSPDESVAIVGTADDEVLVVGADGDARRVSWPEHHEAPGVSAATASSAARQIVVALQNSEIVSVGVHDWRAKAGSGMGTAVALDTARGLVASGHAFGHVHVWNAVSGNAIGAWQLHSGPVFALAFGADGHVYSAGADRCILATDPATGHVVSATMTASPPVALRTTDAGLFVLDATGGLYSFGSLSVEPQAS